ncbi:hypothetical protein AAFN46_16930 [Pseudomonas sp. CAU 1711]|uniref:hypothetical protein n=1 Tax=Pseudomonas sp. CAU 1711 TaxID=3140356 RepID=UPI003261C38D
MPQLTWLGDAQAKRTAQHVPYRLLETLSQHGEAHYLKVEKAHDKEKQGGNV